MGIKCTSCFWGLKMKIISLTFFLTIACNTVSAGTSSGDRNILNIGCHKNDNTCFVTISGSAVGPTGCSSTSVRWNAELNANGKAALTHLTSAFIANKKIAFQISDSCYKYQTNDPTFDWWYVK